MLSSRDSRDDRLRDKGRQVGSAIDDKEILDLKVVGLAFFDCLVETH